jgi:hypothetical protein
MQGPVTQYPLRMKYRIVFLSSSQTEHPARMVHLKYSLSLCEIRNLLCKLIPAFGQICDFVISCLVKEMQGILYLVLRSLRSIVWDTKFLRQ